MISIMTPHALLFTISAIGISETVYLIQERVLQRGPICLVGSTCKEVLESSYNRVIGIHNDVLGLVFYVGVAVLTALLVIGIQVPFVELDSVVKFMIAVGVVMSGIFTYIQWRIIQKWCFWCLMSAFTTGLMAIIVLISNISII